MGGQNGAEGSAGGAGGIGLSSSISGSLVTYSAGGAGGFDTILSANGAANTGNGGRGDGGNSDGVGSNGGSGIVVIRYPSYLGQAASTTGSPQTYIAGTWRVYVWVSSGTITF
jgi:hypothetical protein